MGVAIGFDGVCIWGGSSSIESWGMKGDLYVRRWMSGDITSVGLSNGGRGFEKSIVVL